MTMQEYLGQGRMLEKRIAYDVEKLKGIRLLALSVSGPNLSGAGVQTSPAGDAPFVRTLERIAEMQERISSEIDTLLSLREQMDRVIRQLPREDYQMLLAYRYMENMTWDEVSDRLLIGRTTAKEWHRAAMAMLTLPEEPIRIRAAS